MPLSPGTRIGPYEVNADDASAPAKTGSDFWILTMAGRRREPLLQSPFNERNGELSSDGRWLAYASDESGQNEVFVRPFPDVNSGRWQISTGGGSRPVWSRSGDELFFVSASGEVMGARIDRGSVWKSSAPVKVVDAHYDTGGGADRPYDVSPDGRRFLMIKSLDNAHAATSPQMVVVQNWLEELKRLVPIK